MSRRKGVLPLCVWSLMLGACAHVDRKPQPPVALIEGQASYQARAHDDADTAHYSLAMGESAVQPVVQVHVAPVYPPGLIGLHLPAQDIPVQLAVNGEGQVYNVVVPGEATADAPRRAFIAAIRAAVAQWRFSPLIIRHMAANADGEAHLVDVSRPPFSQFYVFHFELRNGIPASDDVLSASTPGSAPTR